MNDKNTKLLKGLFSLDHNVKIYIPSTDHVNEKIDNSGYIKEALTLFSGLFGGSTSYEAIGAWQSSQFGLVTENITIVESYADKKQVNEGLSQVIKYASKLKKELNQEAISLEYDNKLYFI